MKYLDVLIDPKMYFSEEITQTVDKAARGVMSLSRLMVNVVVRGTAEKDSWWQLPVSTFVSQRSCGLIP